MQQAVQLALPLVESELEGRTVPTIKARELHAYLEVKNHFKDWITDRIEQYGFAEGQDYLSLAENSAKPTGGRPTVEYYISLDMAKELAMVERNDIGRQVRKYFINCERQVQDTYRLKHARELLIVQQQYVTALERAEELKRDHYLFPRTALIDNVDHVAVKRIKRDIAPYLAEKVIIAILQWYGQQRTTFQFGSHTNAVVKPFIREGVEAHITNFLETAERRISFSRKSVILQHDCLIGSECQISREDAIAYLGYTAEQFED